MSSLVQTNSIKNAIRGGGGSLSGGGSGGTSVVPLNVTYVADALGFVLVVYPVLYDVPPTINNVTSTAPGFSYGINDNTTTFLLIKCNAPGSQVTFNLTGTTTGTWKSKLSPIVFSATGNFTSTIPGTYAQTLTIPTNYTPGSPIYFVTGFKTQYSPSSSGSQNLMYPLYSSPPQIVFSSSLLEPGDDYSVQIQDYFGSPINQPQTFNHQLEGFTPGQTLTMFVRPVYSAWTMTNPEATIFGIIYQ